MPALREYAIGLAVAHVAWLWFWLCGSAVRPAHVVHAYSEEALLDVVITTVTGIALTGTVTFGLGLCGALVPITALFAIPVLILVMLLRGDSVFGTSFYRQRLRLIKDAVSPGSFVIYCMSLILAFPALVPDNGSDATAFYLAQAADYANSHRLAVDPWFRFPYYTNNWVLIETWPEVLRLGSLGQFISWLCGCITLLGTYGLIVYGARINEGAAGMRGIRAIGIAGVSCVALTAMYVKVLDIGMIDAPSAMLFLVILIATIVGAQRPNAHVLACLVLCGGFLVGVKVSFVALVPLLIGLCWIVCARLSTAPAKRLIIAVLALVAISSPWYCRAFVLAGDPIAPLLNLHFHGVDSVLSRADIAAQMSDLETDNSPRALLQLPFQLFANFKSRGVRDFGTTLIAVLLPVPLMYVSWSVLRRKLQPTPLLINAIGLMYAYGYWIETSHLGRYALLFLPCFVAFIATLIATVTARSVSLRYAGAVVMFFLAYPSVASWNETLAVIWQLEIADVGLYYTDSNSWLEQRSPAYPQIEDVSHLLARARRQDLHVYVIELGGAQYFFKQHHTTMIGEAFGPARFSGLSRALVHNQLQPYIKRFAIGAFIVPEYALTVSPWYAGINEQLSVLGWRRARYPASTWILYTSPELPALKLGEGHP